MLSKCREDSEQGAALVICENYMDILTAEPWAAQESLVSCWILHTVPGTTFCCALNSPSPVYLEMSVELSKEGVIGRSLGRVNRGHLFSSCIVQKPGSTAMVTQHPNQGSASVIRT